MDSGGRSIKSYNNVGEDECAGNDGVDLTLKLGLPYDEDANQSNLIRQQVDHNPTATHHLTNFSISGPCTPHQEFLNSNDMAISGGSQANRNPNAVNVMNYGMMASHGGNAVTGNMGNNANGGHSFNLNRSQTAWVQQKNYNQNDYGEASVVGIPIITPPNYFNAPLNNYNYIMDNSSPAATMVAGSSSSSSSSSNNNSRHRDSRRQRSGNYHDPSKRCSNHNCNTNDTPMWRKGPLGPKTLCNACGIKYRKEVEKKRAKEAASGSNG